MKTNIEYWKALQDDSYFEKHKRYNGIKAFGEETYFNIKQFTSLNNNQNVLIIGCGYGREVIQIAHLINHVYGIDVNETILNKADTFTKKNNVHNFTGLLAEDWEKNLDVEIDLVYSMVTMQHLTNDLVYDYFKKLKTLLPRNREIIIQFLTKSILTQEDADLRKYEPSVGWSEKELKHLAMVNDFNLKDLKTASVNERASWTWLYLTT